MAGRNLLAAPNDAPAPAGRNLLAPAVPTPEEERANRLRKIARAGLEATRGATNIGDMFGDAFTLGLQKPVGAAAQVLGGEVNDLLGTGEPATMGERWKASTGAYDDLQAEREKQAGWGGKGAQLAGSLLSGGPVRGAVETGFKQIVGNAAKLGAVEGAARNSNDLQGAATGAITDAATAAGGAAIVKGLTGRLIEGKGARAAEREANKGIPPEQLKDNARALYKQLDDAGVAYDFNQVTDLADEMSVAARAKGYLRGGTAGAMDPLVDKIEGMRANPMTLSQLQQLRTEIGASAKATEPHVREVAGKMLQALDGFVANVDPAQSQLGSGQVPQMWGEARKLWRAANTAEDIGYAVTKAERRAASTNSGQNAENAIRQNVRQVVDKAEKPGRWNPYNDAEIAQMEKIVRGTTKQNATRWLGNQVSGWGTGIAGLGGAGGMLMGGGDPMLSTATGAVMGAGAQGLGHLIKGKAANMAQDEADTLMRMITTGSAAPARSAAMAGPPTREMLARIQAQRMLERGLGRFAGGQM